MERAEIISQETFGLRIPEKELRNFVTIGDLVDYLAANAG